MMNYQRFLFLSLFSITAIIAVALPFYYANAALVPCGLSQDDPSTLGNESRMCTTCDFFVLIDNVKNFLLVDVLTPVAVLFIVIGGILILTGGAKPGNVAYGRKIITDTVIGIFVIFSAWMITNTIIQIFAGNSLSTWYSISCDVAPPGPGPGGSPTPTTTVITGNAQTLAQQILAKHPAIINLSSVQSTGTATSALQNIRDVAAGRCARSGVNTCVSLNTSMLSAMLTLSNTFRYSVSAIAGGAHCKSASQPGCAGPSAHYFGRAFDVNWINGVHVGPNDGNSYNFMRICLSSGARQAIGPRPLPPGAINNSAHDTHIHCGW